MDGTLLRYHVPRLLLMEGGICELGLSVGLGLIAL